MVRVTPEVLVLRHNALGDLVTARPALLGLRRRFPGHRVVMTCPRGLAPLASRLGMADELVSEDAHDSADPADHESLDEALLSRALARDPAEVLVALRTPTAALWHRLSEHGHRRLVVYRHPDVPATAGAPVLDFAEHILVRWQRLLDGAGVPTDPDDRHVDDLGPLPPGPHGHVLVHIGAGSPARRWPLERWAAVARALDRAGHHVLLTGSPAERRDVAEVRSLAGLPRDRDLTGSTDSLALAALVRRAALLVSVDTGIAQVATALGRPSVCLFGPVSPAQWGPPAGDPRHEVIWKGRYGEPYADVLDPGLAAITVDDVLAAVDRLRPGVEP